MENPVANADVLGVLAFGAKGEFSKDPTPPNAPNPLGGLIVTPLPNGEGFVVVVD